ncbi:MAG: GNAT family N-acetyltransferase [Planctomycetota bacterium]
MTQPLYESTVMIRRLTPGDAEAFSALRNEALLAVPLAFASSPDDDFASTLDELRDHLDRAPDSVIFGAFVDDALVGTAGFLRDRHLKAAHKAHLWGMYVAPAARRQGLAAALVETVIKHARGVSGVAWLQLGVSATVPDAQRVYERAGFTVWGTEPAALRHDGVEADQYHMIRAL